ncbi:arylsulfatase A family protein [gamma proteobacterium HIMB55]|nr:arylsulfatase A family protein [gamma proteobacterium HIMB55]
MKKILLAVSLGLIVLAAIAYQNQTQLLLGFIKYRSANEYEVGPPRSLAWNAGPNLASESPDERPPNIILIVADDLGYNDISTFGGGLDGGRVKTPHIDQLAADGVVFTQSYSGAGTCAPSRAMLMTGRYPTRTGFEFTPTPSGMAPMLSRISAEMGRGTPSMIYDAALDESKPPYEQQGLPPEEVTIAEILKERGYATFHIGKWHLGRQDGMAPHEQGFDQSLLMASGLFLPEDDPNVVNAKLDFDPIDQFLWARMAFANSFNSGDQDRFEPGGYLTDYWTDESINIINANKNRPFFLYLGHWGVHTPLQATREDYEAVGDITPHRKRVYAAMIRSLDRSVGRINKALEELGIADNTLVVFTNDNGGPGYIGLPDINKPFRGWKISQFEGGIRVPLMMKWPARISPGTVSEEPVAHIDVMPTLAAAAEAPEPEGVIIDGENLLPLATGAGLEAWDRDTLFWQSGHYRVVRHKDWKLQVTARPDKRWLFNLAGDPTEQINLAESKPEKVTELMALLDAHAAAARPALYPAVLESAITIDKTLVEPFEEGDDYIYWPN